MSRMRTSLFRSSVVACAALAVTLVLAAGAQAAGGVVLGFGENSYGQADGSPTTVGCVCVKDPTQVAGVAGVTQVSGGFHSLALLADGSIRSWGYNEYGQLGNGSNTDNPAPQVVAGISNAIAISTGINHSLALLANGTVMAWGRNNFGQLGLGTPTGPETCSTTVCSKNPVQVPGLANVVAISASGDFSVALLADGTVMTWGFDNVGQLGDGVGVQDGCQCVAHPVPVPGVSGVTTIAAGQMAAVALLRDGTVRDWGNNTWGQLGNGTDGPETTPCACQGPVAVSGLAGVRAIGAGVTANAAVMADGTVRVWGGTEYGQLGNGTADGPEQCRTSLPCSKTPSQVPGLSGVQTIAVGLYHLGALLPDGTTRSWGYNEFGEFGNGTTDHSFTPVPSTISGASALTASAVGSLALVGPSQTLSVSLAGSGSGSAVSREVNCPSLCTGRYPQGQVDFLRAIPATPGQFAGFSGACAGTAPCQLRMDSDQSATATFGVPTGTRITAAKINRKRKTAKFSFSAPGAITGYQCLLVRPKAKRHGAKKSARKAKKPKFASCATPKTYKHLKPGRFTFKVRALDILGADAKPAKRAFRLKPPRHSPKAG